MEAKKIRTVESRIMELEANSDADAELLSSALASIYELTARLNKLEEKVAKLEKENESLSTYVEQDIDTRLEDVEYVLGMYEDFEGEEEDNDDEEDVEESEESEADDKYHKSIASILNACEDVMKSVKEYLKEDKWKLEVALWAIVQALASS